MKMGMQCYEYYCLMHIYMHTYMYMWNIYLNIFETAISDSFMQMLFDRINKFKNPFDVCNVVVISQSLLIY